MHATLLIRLPTGPMTSMKMASPKKRHVSSASMPVEQRLSRGICTLSCETNSRFTLSRSEFHGHIHQTQ